MDNSQNQNNNQPIDSNPIQPDYTFLQNYEAPLPPKKKKLPIILVGLVVVLGFGTLVLAVLAKDQTSEQPRNQNTAEQSNANGNITVATKSLFVEHVLANRDDEAYALMDEDLKRGAYPDKESFTRLLATGIRNLLSKNECAVVDPLRSQDKQSYIQKCTIADNAWWMGFGINNRGTETESVYTICSMTKEELGACR